MPKSTRLFTYMWRKLKTTPLLKPISFTGQVKMSVHWNLEQSQQTLSHEALGVSSAQIIYVHTLGAKCRD